MCEHVIARIEVSVLVMTARKRLFGVLNKIQWSKGVAQSILDGQACSRNSLVGIVVPGEGIPVGEGEDWHFKTDQGILNGGGQIVRSIAGNIVRDGAQPYENGQKETLPVRGKYDAFDAQELGHRPEGLQVLRHAHPEHSKGVQADCDADIVDDAAPEVARGDTNVALLVGPGGLHDDGGDGEDGLDPCILEDAPLDSEEGIRV